MKRLAGILALCVVPFLLSACHLDRSALGSAPGETLSWDVQPPLFCPGDPVTVSWDFSDMHKSPDNCRPPNGGFDALTSCTSSSRCPGGAAAAVCLDGYCCRHELYDAPGALMCAGPAGCYPPFDISITSDTVALDPPVQNENRFVTGTRTVSPTDTTTFTISGLHTNPPFLFGESKVATMIEASPPTNITLRFPFICTGTGGTWGAFDMDNPVMATEHARIAGVRNTSGHIIRLGRIDPPGGPVTLNPGETTMAFNGSLHGKWSASLDPRDPARLIVPICRPTFSADPWPDLQVEVALECSAAAEP